MTKRKESNELKMSMALCWASRKSFPPKKRLRRLVPFATPYDYVLNLFQQSSGLAVAELTSRTQREFLKPSQEMIDGYTSDVLIAVRENDLEKLKELHRSGHSMQCCNKFGESLLHMACRRGLTSIVKFLVEEAKVSLKIRDDYHKTPLHDAFWTVELNFELLDILIKEVPEHLLMPDIRGFTPLEYVRQSQSGPCFEFLFQRKDLLRVESIDRQ